MKIQFASAIVLTLLVSGCSTYKPTDILANTDKLKVYWLNGQQSSQAIYMGEDSNAINDNYRLLFEGNKVSKPITKANGRLSFLQNSSVVLDCFYNLDTKPWISYTDGNDTIFLQLGDKGKALLGKYKAPSPDRFAWLQGVWVAQGDNRPVYEEWTIGANHYPVGRSYSIYAGDTAVNEELSIKVEKSMVAYMAKVPTQNGGRQVPFEWQPTSDQNVLHFTNPWHDFPQDISYKRINSDSMVAVVKGKGSSFEMGMKKLTAVAVNP